MKQKVCTEDTHLLLGYSAATDIVLEHSIDQDKMIHEFDQSENCLSSQVISIAINMDKKTFFLSSYFGKLNQYDQHSKKHIKKFHAQNFNELIRKFEDIDSEGIIDIAVSYDGRQLIIVTEGNGIFFVNVRNHKLSNVLWVDKAIFSIKCSYDGRFLFLGHSKGFLSVIEIQKNCILRTFQILVATIFSIDMFRDNQSAIASDRDGNIIKIGWDINANNNYKFRVVQNFQQLGSNFTMKICIAADQQNLLIGSGGIIRLFNFKTCEIKKEFKLADSIRAIELIKNDTQAVIVESNGSITVLDMKRDQIAKQNNKEYLTYKNYSVLTAKAIC